MNFTSANNSYKIEPNVEQIDTARFFVYENLKFIGESVFAKKSILIGKDTSADLVLDHQSIANIHAMVELRNGQAYIHNKNSGNGLRLNGFAVDASMLKAEDVIQLGPFSIIFRQGENGAAQKSAKNKTNETVKFYPVRATRTAPRQATQNTDASTGEYSILLVNQYLSERSRQNAVANLAKLFRINTAKIKGIVNKPEHVLKSKLEEKTARKLEATLKNAGVMCVVQSELDAELGFLSPQDFNLDADEDQGMASVPAQEAEQKHKESSFPDSDPAPEPDHQASVYADEPGLSLATEFNELSSEKEQELTMALDTGDEEPELSLAPDSGPLPPAIEPVSALAQEPDALTDDDEPELSLAPEGLASSPAQEPELSLAPESEQLDQPNDTVFSLDPDPYEAVSSQEPELSLAPDSEALPPDAETELSLVPDADSPLQDQDLVFSMPIVAEESQQQSRTTSALKTPTAEKPVYVKTEEKDLRQELLAESFESELYDEEYEDIDDQVYIDLSAPIVVDDDDDDDDDPWYADFSLKDKLASPGVHMGSAQKLPVQMQIIKTVGDRVVDTYFLPKGEKYFIETDHGRLCIAENKSEDKTYTYISPELKGYITTDGTSRKELGAYRNEAYLYRKRKDQYRVALAKSHMAELYEGLSRYQISLSDLLPSPSVPVPPPEKTMNWRHWAYSAALHFFVIMCCSIYFYVQGFTKLEKEPRFVKVDIAQLKAMEAKKEIVPPPPPKKEPPPPKPEPQRVAEKVKPPEKKVAQKQPPKKHVPKQAKNSKSSKKTARAGQTSRHPNAGGGFGEGNITNRNINQAGILSILGKNAVAGPAEAIASVTNIDAVKVPGAVPGKNFTVGGIKGSLGGGKITMGTSGGGIVTTKGGKQVLRSAGASGPGQVAALERGSVGKGTVKGLVTAKMTRTVKIEGGMSREMVKRVIDQHMSEVTYCYESALSNNPTISGRVIFEWKILMDGRVGEIRIVASSINSHQVHDCIKSAIKSWQFPRPSGSEVVVSFPFVFDLVAF